jgi:hypothetical protein
MNSSRAEVPDCDKKYIHGRIDIAFPGRQVYSVTQLNFSKPT